MLGNNSKLMICKNCCEQNGNVQLPWGEIDIDGSSTLNCSNCGKPMIETNLVFKDVKIISKISTDWNFYQAMMDLKEKDIIEFNLKMSQFKAQIQQSQAAKQQQSNIQSQTATRNQITCPTCGSTNVEKISTSSKMAGAMLFGLLSKTAKSQWVCNNCGYKW